MTDNYLTAMGVAGAALQAQSLRMRVAAENMANADSLGYRRKLVTFSAQPLRDDGVDSVAIKPMRVDSLTQPRQQYDPGNPVANKDGYVVYSNVNPLLEMTDAKQAQHSYEASLSMFDQARTLYDRTIDMMKR